MFQPAIFHEDRADVMHALMRDHPFATLVTRADGRVAADHLPLALHEGSGGAVLRGHVARGNPIAGSAALDDEALAIFQGPQGYVSPSWYASKREHGRVVPTWNYVVVQARGPLRLVRNGGWLLQHLRDLTSEQESHRPLPWAVEDAPRDFVARMLRGIVGVEIAVETLEGTWKVSQNKSDADRAGVADGLGGDAAMPELARLVTERGAPSS